MTPMIHMYDTTREFISACQAETLSLSDKRTKILNEMEHIRHQFDTKSRRRRNRAKLPYLHSRYEELERANEILRKHTLALLRTVDAVG